MYLDSIASVDCKEDVLNSNAATSSTQTKSLTLFAGREASILTRVWAQTAKSQMPIGQKHVTAEITIHSTIV